MLLDEILRGGPGGEDLWWVAHPGRSIAEPGVGAGLTQSSPDDHLALIHARNDLPSVVRSINDELATPVYDAFTAKTLSTVPVA
jgi:hypothetical protein